MENLNNKMMKCAHCSTSSSHHHIVAQEEKLAQEEDEEDIARDDDDEEDDEVIAESTTIRENNRERTMCKSQQEDLASTSEPQDLPRDHGEEEKEEEENKEENHLDKIRRMDFDHKVEVEVEPKSYNSSKTSKKKNREGNFISSGCSSNSQPHKSREELGSCGRKDLLQDVAPKWQIHRTSGSIDNLSLIESKIKAILMTQKRERSVNAQLHEIHHHDIVQQESESDSAAAAAEESEEENLMNLLQKCLETDHQKGGWMSTVVLAGNVCHFESRKEEDLGWGCGWRNIQMLSFHLMMQVPQMKDVLFGGVGFVPDILALQNWLEVAWAKGFDLAGADYFDWHIHGTRKWIGTTECAALLRSFGVRARIVDFQCAAKKKSKGNIAIPGGGGGVGDRREKSSGISNSELTRNLQQMKLSSSSTIVSDHRYLVDWVWNYFMEMSSGETTRSLTPTLAFDPVRNKPMIRSKRSPLYFQHRGHSRTIVGIERQQRCQGGGTTTQDDELFLLVFDPSQKTQDLTKALGDRRGWQRLLKRGIRSLKHAEYQLCYVDEGIASGEESESLKFLTSIHYTY